MRYVSEQQRTETRKVPSVEFRTSFQRLGEPVDVTVLGRVIGTWYPREVLTGPVGGPYESHRGHAAVDPVDTREAPASRSGPVIPSGSLVVGTAETDRAQIGTPEQPGDPLGVPTSHEPRGGQHSPPLGSSPLTIIPPKPDGYVHDPTFNSKGSHAAPKARK